MLPTRKEPYSLDRDEPPAFWTVGLLARTKATGQQTGGTFVLFDEVCQPGYATFLHVHHLEDESFYVLEGNLVIHCGGIKVKAGPGTFVYGPRDIPHGFEVEGSVPARLLIWSTPSGVENMLSEAGQLPPEADLERHTAIAARYGVELLGPLPE